MEYSLVSINLITLKPTVIGKFESMEKVMEEYNKLYVSKDPVFYSAVTDKDIINLPIEFNLANGTVIKNENPEFIDLVIWPSQVLRKKGSNINNNDELQKLAVNMLLTMYTSPGIGLAAQQIGITERIFVADPEYKDTGTLTPMVFLNPFISETDSLTFSTGEGCLSCPGFRGDIKRFGEIVAGGTGLDGEEYKYTLTGLPAFVFQHELDHLDGILCIDKVSFLKRDMWQRKYKKADRLARKKAKALIRAGLSNENLIMRDSKWTKKPLPAQ